MFSIERTCDGGFTWERIDEVFATATEAHDYMVAHEWERLAEMTYGEEGARVVAL